MLSGAVAVAPSWVGGGMLRVGRLVGVVARVVAVGVEAAGLKPASTMLSQWRVVVALRMSGSYES